MLEFARPEAKMADGHGGGHGGVTGLTQLLLSPQSSSGGPAARPDVLLDRWLRWTFPPVAAEKGDGELLILR